MCNCRSNCASASLREAPARAPGQGHPQAWPGRPPAVHSEACAREPCGRPRPLALPPGSVKHVQLSFKMRRRETARGSCPGSGPRPSPRLTRQPPGGARLAAAPPGVHSEACARALARGHTHACPARPPGVYSEALPEPGPVATPTPGRWPPGGIQRGFARALARGHTRRPGHHNGRGKTTPETRRRPGQDTARGRPSSYNTKPP